MIHRHLPPVVQKIQDLIRGYTIGADCVGYYIDDLLYVKYDIWLDFSRRFNEW